MVGSVRTKVKPLAPSSGPLGNRMTLKPSINPPSSSPLPPNFLPARGLVPGLKPEGGGGELGLKSDEGEMSRD